MKSRFDLVCNSCNQIAQGFKDVRILVDFLEDEVIITCPYCEISEVFDAEEVLND
ncbi:Uncharacterised protein [Streptococcus suis]|uniref:Uncharacterized protein n=1 Tax=Streptococcus suis TaxID=1307 RepID=A0A116QZA9_STRSU|nr:Uncharacterised protein [Streptococcus suis]CYX39749.1 Uncharacterised protein [Streptococcus suis]